MDKRFFTFILFITNYLILKLKLLQFTHKCISSIYKYHLPAWRK